MRRPRLDRRALAALVLLTAAPACRETSDTVTAADEQMAELVPEHMRHLPTTASDDERWARAQAVSEAHAKGLAPRPGRAFPEDSPEARLLTAIEHRLACRDDACASEALGRIRAAADRLLPALPALLEEQPDAVLIEAIRLAGLFARKDTVAALGQLAIGGSRPVRAEAVWALGEVRDPAGARPLVRVALSRPEPGLRPPLCRALRRIGAAEGVQGLAELIGDADPLLRRDCVDALGDIAAREAVDQLSVLAMEHGDAATREAAVTALRRNRAPEAAVALKRLARSGPADVRKLAGRPR